MSMGVAASVSVGERVRTQTCPLFEEGVGPA